MVLLVLILILLFLLGTALVRWPFEVRQEEYPSRLRGFLYRILALLLVGLAGLGLVAWLRDLPSRDRAVALCVIGAAGLGFGWFVHRLRSLRRARLGRQLPVSQWREKGLGPSQGTVELQAGQCCPVCKDEHVPTSEAAECPACRTLFHLHCALELGRCTSLGCAGKPRRVDALAAPRGPAGQRPPAGA